MRRSLVPSDAPMPFRLMQSGQARYASRVGFRFKDGRMKSLPYSHLVETEYNPDVGIILDYAGQRVTLYGRNLVELYTHFEEEDVGEVTEAHLNEVAVASGDAFIASIGWERI